MASFLIALDPRAIGRLVGVELLRDEELARPPASSSKLQPVPVDDRVAAQDEPHGLEVGERELVESA